MEEKFNASKNGGRWPRASPALARLVVRAVRLLERPVLDGVLNVVGAPEAVEAVEERRHIVQSARPILVDVGLAVLVDLQAVHGSEEEKDG